MSVPKVGDRVRVEFEGVVTGSAINDTVRVTVDGATEFAWARSQHCEVLAPPVQAGDTVTEAAQLEALPSGSVVLPQPAGNWAAAAKSGDDWYLANGTRGKYLSDEVTLPATVLHIGGSS